MLIQLQRRQSELAKTSERIRMEMETAEKMSEIEPHNYERYRVHYEQLQQRLAEVEKECEMQTPAIKRIDQMIRVRSKENKSKAASTTFLDQVDQEESSLPTINNNNASLTRLSQSSKVAATATTTTSDTSDKNIENLRKEQQLLENELERVRGLLTHSTKRLEEKAVENAQMEHEMLVARKKLKQVLDAEQRAMELTRSTKLESELANINQVIDDLHNKREDLNAAIENLKMSERVYTDSIRPPNVVAAAAAAASVHHNTPKVFNANLTFKQTTSQQQQPQQTKHQFNRNEEEDDVMPLYENLNNTKIFLNDQLNNNNSLSSSNPSEENNDDFTLNINLEQARTPYQTAAAAGTSTASEDSEINNNELRHNLNSMCEFDPSMTFGDSIVDQQIKQIYGYQMNFPMAKPAGESIKTVREVKRESERRKFNQQQQTRLTQLLNESLMSYGGGYYYYSADMINEHSTAADKAGGNNSTSTTTTTATTAPPSATTLSEAPKHPQHY